MNALPSRVLGYAINLTAPEVAAVLELGRWSGMSWRQWRRMPEVVAVLELGRWSWSIMLELGLK